MCAIHLVWFFALINCIRTVVRLRSGGAELVEIARNSTIRRSQPDWKKRSTLQKSKEDTCLGAFT